MTWCQFDTGNPQILGTTVENLVTLLTWYARFVRTCPILTTNSLKTTILLPCLLCCLPTWLRSRGFPTKLYNLFVSSFLATKSPSYLPNFHCPNNTKNPHKKTKSVMCSDTQGYQYVTALKHNYCCCNRQQPCHFSVHRCRSGDHKSSDTQLCNKWAIFCTKLESESLPDSMQHHLQG